MLNWTYTKKTGTQRMSSTNNSNKGSLVDLEFLVRETIQNATDASLNNSETVRIKFSFKEIRKNILKNYIKDIPKRIIAAKDQGERTLKGINNELFDEEIVQCIYIEDFNTTGLTGDFRWYVNDNMKNDENSNYHKFHSDGYSIKTDDSSKQGSWGMGKQALSEISKVNSYFYFSEADGITLFGGISLISDYIYKGIKWNGDANLLYYTENDDIYTPVIDKNHNKIKSDPNLIEKIKKDFQINRKKNQSGTSLLIPYIVDSLTEEELISYVIKHFSLPIFRKRLVVEVEDKKGIVKLINSEKIFNYQLPDEDKDDLVFLQSVSEKIEKKSRF